MQSDWTSVMSAWASVATAAILLVAGGIAWWQASETRRLRRAQIRPFVVIDFDPQRVPPLIYLTISNVGSTMARDIQFEFEQSLVSSFDKGDTASQMPPIADLPVFVNGIPSLPPGKEIAFFFDSFIEREGMPDTYSRNCSLPGRRPHTPLTGVGGVKPTWTVLRLTSRSIET